MANRVCPRCKQTKDEIDYGKSTYCRTCHASYMRENRYKYLKTIRAWDISNRPKRREYNKKCASKRKLKILTYYGDGKAACVLCGESRIDCLSIDHIHGHGNAHRRSIGEGTKFYQWLVHNNYPIGYRTLCMNCQFVEAKKNGSYNRHTV